MISYQENYNNSIFDLVEPLSKLSNCSYCYILHNDSKESDKHIHIILAYCGYTKTDLLIMFPNADIEIMKSSGKKCFEYLQHIDKKSIEKCKIQYSKNDIVYHDFSEKELLSLKNNYSTKDNDILNEIASDILNYRVKSISALLSRYGGIVIKYKRSIEELIYDIAICHK